MSFYLLSVPVSQNAIPSPQTAFAKYTVSSTMYYCCYIVIGVWFSPVCKYSVTNTLGHISWYICTHVPIALVI